MITSEAGLQWHGVGCYRRWLLAKLFEEISLDDASSRSSDVSRRCSGTRSSSAGQASHSNTVSHSHSDLRHCVVLRELSVCQSAADRYHSNYNAWNHRIWVMDKFTCCRTQVCAVHQLVCCVICCCQEMLMLLAN